MRSRSSWIVVMASVSLLPASTTTASDIVLRSGGVIDAPIEKVGLDGLSIGGVAPRVLGWDQVYFVRGDEAAMLEPYRELSDRVWRAQTRLDRSDYVLAGELFEPLFDRLLHESIGGPTGLVIAEGALRCRLAAGRHGEAVVAWATALRIRETGQKLSGESAVAGVIDPQTRLVPNLAPFWLDGSADAARFVDLDLAALGAASPRTDTLIELYRAAADRDLSGGIFSPSAEEISAWAVVDADQGISMLTQILMASSDQADARNEARSRLAMTVEQQGSGWKEAWARFAIGRSLLLETDRELRDEGVLQLLHLPARFSQSQQHLAALALAEVGREMYRRGDTETLEVVRTDLESGYKGHDAIGWLEDQIGK